MTIRIWPSHRQKFYRIFSNNKQCTDAMWHCDYNLDPLQANHGICRGKMKVWIWQTLSSHSLMLRPMGTKFTEKVLWCVVLRHAKFHFDIMTGRLTKLKFLARTVVWACQPRRPIWVKMMLILSFVQWPFSMFSRSLSKTSTFRWSQVDLPPKLEI